MQTGMSGNGPINAMNRRAWVLLFRKAKTHLRTNETESGGEIPVVAFDMFFRFRSMEYLVEDDWCPAACTSPITNNRTCNYFLKLL